MAGVSCHKFGLAARWTAEISQVLCSAYHFSLEKIILTSELSVTVAGPALISGFSTKIPIGPRYNVGSLKLSVIYWLSLTACLDVLRFLR